MCRVYLRKLDLQNREAEQRLALRRMVFNQKKQEELHAQQGLLVHIVLLVQI